MRKTTNLAALANLLLGALGAGRLAPGSFRPGSGFEGSPAEFVRCDEYPAEVASCPPISRCAEALLSEGDSGDEIRPVPTPGQNASLEDACCAIDGDPDCASAEAGAPECAAADEDTDASPEWNARIGLDESVCQEAGCQIGRPFLVAGSARTASATLRADWASAERAVDASRLSADARRALAEHWALIAAYEHASVGSFARFTLELLALGAPPALLLETQRAAADEVEHARVAYGLAAAYGGAEFGPGPLDLKGVVLGGDVRSVIRGLVQEACVSETIGAAQLLASAEAARSATLSAVLRQMHDEEARHAALGWASLRWILSHRAGGISRFALQALDEAIAAAERAEEPAFFVAPDQGLLPAHERRATKRQTIVQVIGPLRQSIERMLVNVS